MKKGRHFIILGGLYSLNNVLQHQRKLHEAIRIFIKQYIRIFNYEICAKYKNVIQIVTVYAGCLEMMSENFMG